MSGTGGSTPADSGRPGPTFLGLGVQKAATTWLHNALSWHPEVFVSEVKEVDFFTNFYNRGYEWYESHFADGLDHSVRGEASPSYFHDLQVPQRVHAYRSDMRLIVILRDPIKRAFSNHLHEIRKKHLQSTEVFEEAVSNNPMYLEQSLYAEALERWMAVFGRESLLVLLAEEVSQDPVGLLNLVTDHLGVSRPPDNDAISRRSHESVANKSEAMQSVLKSGGNVLRSMGLGEALEKFKEAGPVRQALSINKRDLREEVVEMRDETKRDLAHRFAGDMQATARILGRDHLPWPSWDIAFGGGATDGSRLTA